MSEDHRITITRALVELKTVDRRIIRAQRDAVYVTYKCEDEANPKQKVTPDLYQKINDLIERRKQLKAAIVQSNATTQVVIGKSEYSVAEAIERKRSINYEKVWLNTMKAQLGDVTKRVECHNQKARETVDAMINRSLGNNQKVNVSELSELNETFLKGRRAEIVDPMSLAGKIRSLEDRITNFESEVDLVLTESNSTTYIVVN